MRFYWPIAKVDTVQRMVWGYASTEALDEQDEIVKREAVEAALGDYMRFANIREMHQPSAVGVAKEATIDDRGLYLAAKIVDDEAWKKVVQGVYKGFSIGGRVTARDPANRHIITGLALTEISVVDRPANPEAVFDCWKATGGDERRDGLARPSDTPSQIWACGDPGHHHRNKEAADGCIRKRAAAPESTGSSLLTGRGVPTCTVDEADAVVHVRRPAAAGAEKWATADELAKVHGQSSELVKMVAELAGIVGRMAKQVDDIARTPLPPQTIAYPLGLTGVRKNEDIGTARLPMSDEDIVERFAKLSPTEQTMLLIKAAYRNPMRPGGIGQTDGEMS
jgi:phage head maturation protease